MRILVLNQYYRPEAASSAQRLSELVDDLGEQHDITVVAGRASYDPERAGPAPLATPSRVRVRRVPSTAFHRQQMKARILNYVTYLVSAFVTGMFTRADVVLAATDPPLLGVVGLCISRVRRSAFVHLLWDIQPQVALAAGLMSEGRLSRLIDRLNRWVLRSAAAVIVPTDEMRRSAIALGAAPARVSLLSHWEDTRAVRPESRDAAMSRQLGLADRFVVMYSGNLGLTQGLGSCIELAARVRDLEDVVILLVGEGAAKAALQRDVEARGLTNVRFLPYQPRHCLSRSLSLADVFVVPLGAGLTRYMLSSKVYTIMAAGRPVIAAMDPSSELAGMVARLDCGRVVPPGDLVALEASVRWFRGHPAERAAMGTNARHAAERQWSRALVTPKYVDVIARAAYGAGSPTRSAPVPTDLAP